MNFLNKVESGAMKELFAKKQEELQEAISSFAKAVGGSSLSNPELYRLVSDITLVIQHRLRSKEKQRLN